MGKPSKKSPEYVKTNTSEDVANKESNNVLNSGHSDLFLMGVRVGVLVDLCYCSIWVGDVLLAHAL